MCRLPPYLFHLVPLSSINKMCLEMHTNVLDLSSGSQVTVVGFLGVVETSEMSVIMSVRSMLLSDTATYQLQVFVITEQSIYNMCVHLVRLHYTMSSTKG